MTTTVKASMILVCMVTFLLVLDANLLCRSDWGMSGVYSRFDIALNDLTSYSIERCVLGRQR